VLVIEDEAPIAMALEDGLGLEGLVVEVAADGPGGLARALAAPAPDLVVLDLRLPGMSGLDVLRRLRAEGRRMPVIALTARGGEADRVAGLECGADDYVTKPFSVAELIARVRAHLRREREYRPADGGGGAVRCGGVDAAAGLARFGAVEVDFAGARATHAGCALALTPLELKLLRLLWDERGRTVTRERLLREVWGYERLVVTRAVDFHIGQLRKKIEDDPAAPRFLKTHHGVGYRLEV
jgi:DNA-binding response OmpR family regulator